SLSISSAVLNGLSESGNDSIFWQGDITPEIMKHMENALAKEKRNFKIILPSPSAYEKVIELIDEQYKNRIFQSGYV
ncbi:accessory Sec system glycosylation chaperone GtfB, partial [Staphylococcus epidermidis]